MTGKTAGWIVFALGTALLLGTVVMGQLAMPELHGPNPPPLSPDGGSVAMIKLSVFGASFPLGLGLALAGAALLGGAGRGRGLLLGLLAPGVVGLTRLVPRLFGSESSTLYFGAGGMLILVLFLAVAWTWSQHRLTLPEDARGAADLQGLGYLCFGVAAWFSCGTGGVPGYALNPGQMASAGSLWFAVSNFKVVMAFFVLGWALTLAGLRRAVAVARST